MQKKYKILIAVLALVLFFGGIGIFIWSLKIDVVYTDENGKPINEDDIGTFSLTFAGSERYTAQELEEFFFKSDSDRRLVKFIYNQKFKDKIEIPFVETYDMETLSPTEYKITIYEKSVVGYIEYMGSNMYFDKDGIVVESSTKKLENVPLISGIDYDYIVLHQKLPVENEKVFTVLLDVTQCIEKYEITTENIDIDNDFKIKIRIGQVTVNLGDSTDLNEKIKDLSDIIPTLVDEKGVLDMSVYNTTGSGYTFKKDTSEVK